ncbi:MAG: septum formation initiator family protein [Oscillospiraceae bacterium]|nr:septum formation initiator family protein [Oscillospiraceae bacterium]
MLYNSGIPEEVIDIQKRNRVSPIFKVIFILILAYAALMFFDQQKLLDDKRYELARVKTQIEVEQENLRDLEREKELLMTDESIERIARSKLGMVKPGERVFIDLNRQ